MKIGNLLSTGITLFSLVVLLSILSNVISKIGKQTNLSNKGFSHAPSLIASLRKPNNNKRSSKSRRASKRTGSPKAKKSKLTTGDNSRIITLLNDNTDSMNIKVKVVKKGKVIQLRKGFITNITCNEDSFEKQLYTIRCEKCNCSGPHIRGVSCSNGWCNCEPGYTGKKCQEKCAFGYYGERCKRCKCDTMGIESCDHISGKCNCKDGIYGQQCEKAPCICNGPNTVNGSCDSKGYCFCMPGFNGHKCDDMCNDGRYGQDCKKYMGCYRENIRSYNHINGKCACKTEWEGQRCERIKACKAGEYRPYTYGEYPKKCQKCNCVEANTDGLCNSDGNCICKPGYEGRICDRKCSGNYYGKNCDLSCKCIYDNIKSCHHISGKCKCKVGFRGKLCEKSVNRLQV